MKKIILFFAVLIPMLTFSQYQRLGIIPPGGPLILTKGGAPGEVSSFCSDGSARGIRLEPTEKYIHFQSPQSIEVMADGIILAGGIVELIEKKIIAITTYGQSRIEFRLNPDAPYEKILLRFLKPNVVADREKDFLVEEMWLNYLKELNAVSTNSLTFEAAEPSLKEWQAANGLKPSGLLTSETQDLLKYLVEKKHVLEEAGYLAGNQTFSPQIFNQAEKKFLHDHDVENVLELNTFYNYRRSFMVKFRQIEIDHTYPGETNIPLRNIRQIYNSEPVKSRVTSRKIKTFDNHRTHYYIIQTEQGPIRIKLIKNEHSSRFTKATLSLA